MPEDTGFWHRSLMNPARNAYERAAEHLPAVLGAALVLLVGCLVAFVLRAVARRATALVLARLARTRILQSVPTEGTAYQFVPVLAGGLAFWVTLAISVAASIETLGMPSLSGLVSSAARYLPRILAATLTVFIGMLAGDFVQARVRRLGAQAGLSRADVVGRGLRGITIALAVIIAIEQLGVGSGIILYGLAICMGAAFGAASLAFGLGARTAVGNIIAVHYLRRSYRVGDAVRIASIEGEIAAITRTAVLLETPEGRVEVPASKFSEEISVLLPEREP